MTAFEKASVASWLFTDLSTRQERFPRRGEMCAIFGMTPAEQAPWLLHRPCTDPVRCGIQGYICVPCREVLGLFGQAWDLNMMTRVTIRHNRLYLAGQLTGQNGYGGSIGPCHGCGGSCSKRFLLANIK